MHRGKYSKISSLPLEDNKESMKLLYGTTQGLMCKGKLIRMLSELNRAGERNHVIV